MKARVQPTDNTRIDFNSSEFRIDPFPTYKVLREHYPVCKVEPNGLYALSRYDDVLFALDHHEIFGSGYGTLLQPEWLNPKLKRGDFLVLEDPPFHTLHRSLVNKAFVPRIINALIPIMTKTACRLIDNMQPNKEVEFVRDFSFPYIGKIIGCVTGTDETQSIDELRAWVEQIEAIPLSRPDDHRIAVLEECLEKQNNHFLNIIQDRKAKPRNDLITELVNTEVEGERLSDEMLRQCLDLFIGAGLQTTAQELNSAIIHLSRNPELMQLLHKSPELIPAFVEEILRFNPAAHCLFRKTRKDVVIRNTKIPKDSLLLLLLASANRDDIYFPDPDEFILQRENISQHLAFGHGIHMCIGLALARLEMKIALEMLLKKFSHVSCPPDTKIEWIDSFAARGVCTLPVKFE